MANHHSAGLLIVPWWYCVGDVTGRVCIMWPVGPLGSRQKRSTEARSDRKAILCVALTLLVTLYG